MSNSWLQSHCGGANLDEETETVSILELYMLHLWHKISLYVNDNVVIFHVVTISLI